MYYRKQCKPNNFSSLTKTLHNVSNLVRHWYDTVIWLYMGGFYRFWLNQFEQGQTNFNQPHISLGTWICLCSYINLIDCDMWAILVSPTNKFQAMRSTGNPKHVQTSKRSLPADDLCNSQQSYAKSCRVPKNIHRQHYKQETQHPHQAFCSKLEPKAVKDRTVQPLQLIGVTAGGGVLVN